MKTKTYQPLLAEIPTVSEYAKAVFFGAVVPLGISSVSVLAMMTYIIILAALYAFAWRRETVASYLLIAEAAMVAAYWLFILAVTGFVGTLQVLAGWLY